MTELSYQSIQFTNLLFALGFVDFFRGIPEQSPDGEELCIFVALIVDIVEGTPHVPIDLQAFSPVSKGLVGYRIMGFRLGLMIGCHHIRAVHYQRCEARPQCCGDG